MSLYQQIDEQITALDVYQLSLPVVSRRDHGIGTIAGSMKVVVAEVTTQSGVKGYGEAAPWAPFTGTPEGNFAAIDRYFRPAIVGHKLGELDEILATVSRLVIHCTEAKSAIESALLDAAGKILVKPVWELIGPKVRDSAPMSVSLANPDFDQDLELLKRLQDDNTNIVKVKTGFRDDAFDIGRVVTLKRDFPGLNIRVDYNQGLEVGQAINSVSKMDALEPDFIEQPVRAHEFDMMAELRAVTKTPLLADESVFSPADMKRAVRENICDGVSIKIMKSAGIRNGCRIAEIAGNAGLPAYGGDMFETGLSHLAGMHLMAISPNITLGCEYYHATYYLVEDLLVEPFPIENGQALVPDGPGLGIDINRSILEKYCVRYSGSE